MDEATLNAFVGKAVTDIGALVNGALVVIGDRLGLYRAMAGAGPMTAAELARRSGCAPRYLQEWLSAQAATGYVRYDGADRFTLPDEHALALTDESSPACVIGGFALGLATVHGTDRLVEAFASGAGIGWGEQDPGIFEGCHRFFAPSYRAFLTDSWIPALDGVHDRLSAGARIADVGCGQGESTLLLAAAYPQCTVTGIDPHEGSLAAARQQGEAAGLSDRVAFEVGSAQELQGRYDLVCFFDALHDMGDPVGACQAALAALEPAGTLLVVEPNAGDTLSDNLNPIGAAYYSFSTMLCTPNSLSQGAQAVLGAQAGETRLREVLTGAGFGHVRVAARTPLSMVIEARV